MESRKRPFTVFERAFLTNLILQNSDIVENRKIDAVTSQKKAAVWAKIAEQYNSNPRVNQKIDVKKLKKFWNNSKTKARTRDSESITGGSPPDMEPEHAQVLNTTPNKLSVIKAVSSDASEGADDDTNWACLKNRVNPENPTEEIFILPQAPTPESNDDSEDTSVTPGLEVPNGIPFTNKVHRRRSFESTRPTVQSLKIKILEQDYANRAQKFNLEMEHLKHMQSYELNMKEQEVEHKLRMYQLREEEMIIKIENLRNKKSFE